MVWTQFWDMHSGGGQKEQYSMIYIEAPQNEAISIFYSRFGHNPNRVSCTCCGDDYSVTEYATLEEATEYHRKGGYGAKARTLEQYVAEDDVLVITAGEISPADKAAYVPEQGYVWR